MAQDNELEFILKMRDEASATLRQLNQQFLALGSAVEQHVGPQSRAGNAVQTFHRGLEGLTGRLREFGVQSLAMAGITLSLGRAFDQMIEQVRDAETTNAGMARSLQGIRDQFTGTLDTVRNRARELSDVSLIPETAIVQGVERLARFRVLTDQNFTEVTNIVVRMAQVMRTEPVNAASVLARALERPEAAARMLQRSGIALNRQQQEFIERVNETHGPLAAQQALFDALIERIGSPSSPTGLDGSIKRLSRSWTNFLETLGNTGGASNALQGFFDSISRRMDNVSNRMELWAGTPEQQEHARQYFEQNRARREALGTNSNGPAVTDPGSAAGSVRWGNDAINAVMNWARSRMALVGASGGRGSGDVAVPGFDGGAEGDIRGYIENLVDSVRRDEAARFGTLARTGRQEGAYQEWRGGWEQGFSNQFDYTQYDPAYSNTMREQSEEVRRTVEQSMEEVMAAMRAFATQTMQKVRDDWDSRDGGSGDGGAIAGGSGSDAPLTAAQRAGDLSAYGQYRTRGMTVDQLQSALAGLAQQSGLGLQGLQAVPTDIAKLQSARSLSGVLQEQLATMDPQSDRARQLRASLELVGRSLDELARKAGPAATSLSQISDGITTLLSRALGAAGPEAMFMATFARGINTETNSAGQPLTQEQRDVLMRGARTDFRAQLREQARNRLIETGRERDEIGRRMRTAPNSRGRFAVEGQIAAEAWQRQNGALDPATASGMAQAEAGVLTDRYRLGRNDAASNMFTELRNSEIALRALNDGRVALNQYKFAQEALNQQLGLGSRAFEEYIRLSQRRQQIEAEVSLRTEIEEQRRLADAMRNGIAAYNAETDAVEAWKLGIQQGTAAYTNFIALRSSRRGEEARLNSNRFAAESDLEARATVDRARAQLLDNNAREEQLQYIDRWLERAKQGQPLLAADIQGIRARAQAMREANAIQNSFTAGWADAQRQFEATANDHASMVRDSWQAAFNDLQSAMNNFTRTGKLNFGELARAILADIAMIQYRAASSGLFSMLMKGLGSISFGSTPGITSTSTPATSGGVPINIGGGDGSSFALGGAWVNGIRMMAQGGILNSPTLFRDNNGLAIGGEAGTEAVMPLVRTGSGHLGVRATGGRSPINIAINVEGGSRGAQADREMGREISRQVKQAVQQVVADEQRDGGQLHGSRGSGSLSVF